MQNDSSTFGLSREKLSKLWKMGEDKSNNQDDLDKEQQKAELLQDQLAESLPLDAGMVHMLPDIFTLVCEKLKPFTGCSIKDILLDPETDPLFLKAIKDIYKKQAESSSSELEQEVAVAVYYAAIASALVHHDIRITKFSYKDLGRSFTELHESKWLLPDLRNLFGKARDRCNEHIKK